MINLKKCVLELCPGITANNYNGKNTGIKAASHLHGIK